MLRKKNQRLGNSPRSKHVDTQAWTMKYIGTSASSQPVVLTSKKEIGKNSFGFYRFWLFSLITTAGLLLTQNAAKAAPVDLTFSSPTCASNAGSNCLAAGSIWRFSNVITGASPSSQRDALVTISSLVGGAVVTTINDTATGFPNINFQPHVQSPNTANTTSYAVFNFRFVAPGAAVGSPSITLGGEVYETAFDIDGNGTTNSLRELVEFIGPTSTLLASPTNLVSDTLVVSGGVSYIVNNSTNVQNGIGTGNSYKATALYPNTTTSFNLVLGSRVGSTTCGSACDRQSSISFRVSDVVPLNDLTVTKSHTGNFTVGIPASYAITVRNSGSLASSGQISITDSLPTGLTIANGPVSINGTNASNWSCSANNNLITCTSNTSIPASATRTFNINGIVVGASAVPSVINTINIAGGNDFYTANNSASDTATVTVSDLTVTKTHTGDFSQGQTGATYTLTTSNSGTAATNDTVTVIDTLPTGLIATAASGTGWTCTLNSPSLGQVRCTRSDALAVGSSYPPITLTVDVASTAAVSVTNRVDVSGGGEIDTGNNSAVDTTNVTGVPDLAITKTHTGSFTQGQTGATYSITTTNLGRAATNGTVTVTDTLPTGLTATAASGTGWTCTLNSPAAGQVQCTRNDPLAAGNSYPPITLTVNVASNAASSITNNVVVAGGGEVNTANNTAADATTVNTIADLTITKTHVGNFTQGQIGATYSLITTNSGTAATSGTVTVIDTIPTGLTATTAVGLGWTCTLNSPAAGQVKCTRNDALAPGSSYPPITLTVNVATNAAASVTNRADVSGGGEINTSNDTAMDATTVNGAADLTITKTHTGNFTQGQTGATYTLTVTNSGNTAFSALVTVQDVVPTGLTATAASGTGWTCLLNTPSAGQVQCTRNDILTAGSSYPPITLTVDVAYSAASSITNTATVSGVGEINTANNSVSDPTTVTTLSNAQVLLVKRITAINGNRTQNPNDNTPLNGFVDDTTSSQAANDNNPGWPSSSYLVGAINGGKVKSGDTIEYTVYFLNAGGRNADSTRICDRISPNQSFQAGVYGGTGKDLQIKIGTNAVQDLTSANDTNDRAQLYAANAIVPGNCNLKAPNNNGTVVVDITGASGTGIPNLTTLSGSTGAGTPTTSYGYLRFTTVVP